MLSPATLEQQLAATWWAAEQTPRHNPTRGPRPRWRLRLVRRPRR